MFRAKIWRQVRSPTPVKRANTWWYAHILEYWRIMTNEALELLTKISDSQEEHNVVRTRAGYRKIRLCNIQNHIN